jgi:hypothetical protein
MRALTYTHITQTEKSSKMNIGLLQLTDCGPREGSRAYVFLQITGPEILIPTGIPTVKD